MPDSIMSWVGRTETRSDTVTVAPLVALSALLDRDDPPPAAWGQTIARGDPYYSPLFSLTGAGYRPREAA